MFHDSLAKFKSQCVIFVGFLIRLNLNVFSLFIKILLYCHQPVAVADDSTLVNCVKCLVTSWLQCLLHFYFSLIGEGGLNTSRLTVR